jgi:lipopolysaccharide transport system permease protein
MLTTTAPRRKILITPPSRWPLPKIHTLWEAREILIRFGIRDITIRYRQTILGITWVILQPLLAAGIFSVVFGKVAKLPSGGVSYLLFSYAGLLGWNFFNTIVSRSSTSLVANSSLVSKVFFPRMLVPLSTVCSALVDLSVAFCLLIFLWISYGVYPGIAILLFPIWLFMFMMLATGIGMVASALMVKYRDINYIVPFALQLLLYASPIAYSVSAVPHNYRLFFDINPITWLVADMRWSLLNQPAPSQMHILLSVTVPIAVFMLGAMIFEKMERGFADFI